jgi:hypothetical protein
MTASSTTTPNLLSPLTITAVVAFVASLLGAFVRDDSNLGAIDPWPLRIGPANKLGLLRLPLRLLRIGKQTLPIHERN